MPFATKRELQNAARAFCHHTRHTSTAIPVTPLGHGNINDTYLVHDGQHAFVLQRINRAVFPDAAGVAANFATVSKHILSRSRKRALNFLCSEPVLTVAGELIFYDQHGDCWRAQKYLEHLSCRTLIFTRDTAVQLGQVLARFHLLTEDLDSNLLSEPIPGFHCTPKYLASFDAVFKQWRGKSPEALMECLRYVDKYRMNASRLEAAEQQGFLKRRTIHGDPKLDNVIFSADGLAVGLFDLDTTGPGVIHYDLGDCLRSCCNSVGEAADRWQRVTFDLDICEAVLEGYLGTAKKSIDDKGRSLIYDAILIISFELGLRFLTDYLVGNVYFKVSRADENLFRALNQFHLMERVAARESTIRKLAENLCRE